MATPGPPSPQPLGLPRGSVRATLALVLCGSLWYLVARGQPVAETIANAAILVIAFYFGVRSTMPAAPVGAPTTWQPLYLPRGTVRSILLLGFFGVIALAWYRSRSLNPALLLIGQVLVSYVAGVALSAITSRRPRPVRGPSLAVAAFRHAIAIAAVGTTVLVCGSVLFDQPALPPIAQNALAWVVSFYFGSRVAP